MLPSHPLGNQGGIFSSFLLLLPKGACAGKHLLLAVPFGINFSLKIAYKEKIRPISVLRHAIQISAQEKRLLFIPS